MPGLQGRIASHRIAALRSLALILLVSGCSMPTSEPDRDVSALLATAGRDDRGPNPAEAMEFDFGPILAHGQELRHDFPLTNPTAHPIQLLKAEALTPCCSAVGPIPRSIPPGGTAKIPVMLRPGFQTGQKRVQFLVQTDWTERPVWLLTASATLWSAVEVSELGSFHGSLPLGRSGIRRFRIIARSVGSEGRRAPDFVQATAPLSARFAGPPTERTLADDLIEASRDVVVDVPADREPGWHQGRLDFGWTNEPTWAHVMEWRVRPRITISPPGLVLWPTGKRIEQSVLLRSDDRPFRITRVISPLLVDPVEIPLDGPAQLHRLKLVFDPARAPNQEAVDIRVMTDDPDQPLVVLSVLVSSPSKESTE